MYAKKYPEKKQVLSICLTPTAQRLLKDKAKAHGVSASELIEQYVRGTL